MVDCTNGIRELVAFAVNPPWHGWCHKAIWWVQHIIVMFLKEALIVFCCLCYSVAFLKPYFAHYLLCMVHTTDLSLVWGSLNSYGDYNYILIWWIFIDVKIDDYLAKLSDASYTPVVQLHYQLQFVSITEFVDCLSPDIMWS